MTGYEITFWMPNGADRLTVQTGMGCFFDAERHVRRVYGDNIQIVNYEMKHEEGNPRRGFFGCF